MKHTCFTAFSFSVLLLSPIFAHALTHSESIKDINIIVYAPDWIWQKNAVNILITLENTGSESAELTLNLNFPENNADHVTYENADAENTTLTIPAGESIRHAFTNIEALGGVQRQTYPFSIDAALADSSITINYPLTTIRGPVVSSAKWALILPGIICLIWCIVFVIALTRFAKPGAWKTPSDLDYSQAEHQAWMNEKS